MLHEIVTAATAQIPTDGRPSSVYDAFTGYRYRPNIEVGPATTPFPVHYRTNSHGLIAREDFPLAKPAGEYRIGVIGDSFTANVTSTMRWTDVVEDTLNASADWRAITADRTTRVINFGLDGIGAVQFGAVAEHLALPFDLDLVILNMIRNDVIRKPHVRGTQAAIPTADMIDRVRKHVIDRIDWLELYPEVMAVIAGTRLGLTPHLTIQAIEAALSQGTYYASASEAAAASAVSIETVLAHFPAAIFLVETTYPEFLGVATPITSLEDQGLADLRAKLPAVMWTNVIDAGRAPKSRRELDTWFNLPSDQHKSDVGVSIYGEAVAAFLERRKPSSVFRSN